MLQEVITTLCMVESPVAAITVSASAHEPADKEEKEGLLETGPTITLVNQQPITSSIRGTVRHLVAHAGRGARFRGFWAYFTYTVLSGMSVTFFSAALPSVPGQTVVVAAVTGALLANVHATWTHKVVSMPTTKTFFERIPGKAHWKTLAVPAAIEAAMPYISMYLTCAIAMLMGLHKTGQKGEAQLQDYSGAQWTSLIVRVILMFVFAVSCTLFLCLPAMVTLVRIEASILPEDEDTIVPFDRTFGGRVVSQLMGGTGKVGFLDAWRSFTWEARRRLIKLFVKTFFLMTGLVIFIVHVFLLEAFIICGSALGDTLGNAVAVVILSASN
jgi:hypothetical protein